MNTKKQPKIMQDLAKANFLMFRYNVDIKSLNQARVIQGDSDKPLFLNMPN